MGDLIPTPRPSSGLIPSGGQRRLFQRELTNIMAESGLGQARVNVAAELEAAKLSAVASVGQRALQEVAMLTKLERDLSETVPAAQARLVSIADMTSIAMGSMVMNAARRLGA